MEEPLSKRAATTYARRIAEEGWIHLSAHAEDELDADDISAFEVDATLRRGQVTEVRLEHETWRYRVKRDEITLVVAFVSATELTVVTGWRDL